MKRSLFIALLFLAVGWYCPQRMQSQPMSLAFVDGFVTRYGQPVPGVTVSLVHPRIGRGAPSLTDTRGHYFFVNVPMQPDPYYIEVYWGTELLFRNIILVNQPRIQLPPINF